MKKHWTTHLCLVSDSFSRFPNVLQLLVFIPVKKTAYKMQKSFNAAFQYAHYLIQLAKQKPSKLMKPSKSDQKWKSFPHRLADLYVSSVPSSPNHEYILSGSYLLQKLVENEKLNCLVVNLYPVDEGYSITVKSRTGGDTETSLLSYEDDELLQYIDNQELPPLLVDLLERSQVNLFYNGCIIVEIRDFRNSVHSMTFKTRYTLLKPTTQSIMCDVSMLANDNQRWSWEERHALESALVLATAEPLCLDPSVSVTIVANYFQHSFLSRESTKKVAKSQSAVTLAQKRKFVEYGETCASKWQELFTKKRKSSSRISVGLTNLNPIEVVPENSTLTAADFTLVQKCAKALPRPRTPTDYSDVLIEEYSMEVEKSPGKIQCTKITICHCPATEQYSGTLCFTRDGQSENAHCNFHLGSRTYVDKYITQFTGIFTEEGRKPVKITHNIPGQPPKVTYTPGAREHAAENSVTTANTPNSRLPMTAASLPAPQVPPTLCSTKMADGIQEGEVSNAVSGTAPSSIEMVPSPPAQQDSLENRSPSPAPASVGVSCNIPDEGSIAICDLTMKDSVGFIHGDCSSSPPTNSAAINLGTLNLAQNLGLHNLVSIPGMNAPQTLTVPISLSVMSSGQPTFLTTSTGLAIGSLCGVGSSPSPPPLSESPVHSASSYQINSRVVPSSESQPFSETSIVTVPVCSVASLASPPVIITTGLITSTSSVLSSASTSLLSLPLNVAASNVAAQLVASTVKGSSSTVRPASVSLLQVNSNGQQSSSVPLIGTVQHSLLQSPRSSVSPASNQSASGSSSSVSLTDSGNSPSMASPGLSVTTPLITLLPQNQAKQQVRQTSPCGQPKPKKKKQLLQYNNK